MTRWQMFTEWLAEERRARRERAALSRAAGAFARFYPDWNGALFDETFLRRFEPRAILDMQPGELAEEWARQFAFSDARRRERYVARIAVAAARFQDLLATELRRVDEHDVAARRAARTAAARRPLGQR